MFERAAAYRDGFLTVDALRHVILVRGRVVQLTPSQFRIIALLTRRANSVVTIDEIATELWRQHYRETDRLQRQLKADRRNVKWHICQLRKRISGEGSAIINVRGVGYRYRCFTQVP